MISYIKSENLKFKRTFSIKYIFLAPICITIFAYLTSMSMPDSQKAYFAMTYNWWALLFVPLGSVFFCVFSISKEKEVLKYSALLSAGINKKKFWLSKIIVVTIYLLATSLLLFIFFAITNYLLFGCFPNLLNILYATMVMFLVSICLVSINLFIQYKTSMLVTLAINFIGLISGIKVASTSLWFLSPWGYSLRLLSPILGIHPNGQFLKIANPLWDKSVIILGIALVLIIFIISTFITTFMFNKEKEVR